MDYIKGRYKAEEIMAPVHFGSSGCWAGAGVVQGLEMEIVLTDETQRASLSPRRRQLAGVYLIQTFWRIVW